MALVADTTVLIDLWRYRKKPARLKDLEAKVGKDSMAVPWITEAEFSRGAHHQNSSWEDLENFLGAFSRIALDRATMRTYCELWSQMARAGHASSYPDLWIGASAVTVQAPVLTRNRRHFEKIPGLKVISYELAAQPPQKIGDSS